MLKSSRVMLVVACAAALAGCGGSSSGKHAQGALPPRARALYGSDRAVTTAHPAGAQVTGTLLASLGFVPTRDGFPFQNYGFVAGTDVDQRAMRELFGDQVCADQPSDSCTLTPVAQHWADATTADMAGGHCFGFAATSLRFFRRLLNPAQFGASTTFSLSFTPPLQSEIAYTWATQEVQSAQVNNFRGRPSSIVRKLERAMANPNGEVYVLSIRNGYGPDSEGHAIVPTGIQDLGGGHYDLLVYDNNYPGVTRAIPIDTKAQTWSYQIAPSPQDPTTLWSGRGADNPMQLTPLSTILRRQPCPFCGNPSTSGTDTISLTGNPDAHAHLLITNSAGQQLGFVRGKFVNQIKGAHLVLPSLSQIWKARPEPIYELPARGRLTITLAGDGATGQDAAEVHVTGPGFGATIVGLRPRAGSRDQLVIGPGAGTVSMRSHGDAPGPLPTLELARRQGRAGSELSATPQALGTGALLTVALAPTGNRVSVRSSGTGKAAAVRLALHRVGPSGALATHTGGVSLLPGRAQTFSAQSSG